MLEKDLALEFQRVFVNDVSNANVDALITKMKDIEKAALANPQGAKESERMYECDPDS